MQVLPSKQHLDWYAKRTVKLQGLTIGSTVLSTEVHTAMLRGEQQGKTGCCVQGATPLAVTVCCKHKQLTELLLKQGANPSPVVRLVCQ